MSAASTKNEMVLIVDDDPSVTTSLALLLKQAGYRSQTAATPAQAIERIASGDTFHLVIQDMNFSRKTTGEEGMELLKRIKAVRPQLPVVLLTAWGSIQLAV